MLKREVQKMISAIKLTFEYGPHKFILPRLVL